MLTRTLAVILLSVASAAAQTVTASFALQPLEAWKAAIGDRLQKTAVYDVTVCNVGQQAAVVPSGRIIQAARTKFATVSPLLVTATVARSQSKTGVYRAVEIGSYIAWAISVAATSTALQMPDSAKVALPLTGEALSHAANSLRSRVPVIDRSAFLDGSLALGANACESKLILGEYRKDVQTFTAVIQ